MSENCFPINYENIKTDYEFHEYLEKKYPHLLFELKNYNYNLSNIPVKNKKRIFGIYQTFTETKENWFPSNRISKNKSPIVSENDLKTWLERNIVIMPIPGFLKHTGFKYEIPENLLKQKAAERLLPVLKLLAQNFPALMNILIHNKSPKIMITPSKTEYGAKESSNKAAAQVVIDRIVMFSEFDILDDQGIGQKRTSRLMVHEFFHLIDATTTTSETSRNRRKNPLGYVYILNKRLHGKLEKIAKKENQKATKFLNELMPFASSLFNSIPAVRTDAEENAVRKAIEEALLNKINALSRKYKICYPIFPLALIQLDKKWKLSIEVFEDNLSLTELFPRIMESYFYNKDILKKSDPELYNIIEKEILPDFK